MTNEQCKNTGTQSFCIAENNTKRLGAAASGGAPRLSTHGAICTASSMHSKTVALMMRKTNGNELERKKHDVHSFESLTPYCSCTR